jgi:uncharacterized cupin superfamily protein
VKATGLPGKLAFARLLEYNAGYQKQWIPHFLGLFTGGIVRLKVTDVERLKKQARKLAAGQVLSGDRAEVCLELAQVDGCQAQIAAGYGTPSTTPQPIARDRLIWILDGFAEVRHSSGRVTNVSQGESTVLSGGQTYQLTFPQLSIYLAVEAVEKD